MSSPSESLIVDCTVNSLNTFIEEIRLSLVTLAISPCDGGMVEYRYGEMVQSRDGEMVECRDGEMLQFFFKSIGVKSKVVRLI